MTELSSVPQRDESEKVDTSKKRELCQVFSES